MSPTRRSRLALPLAAGALSLLAATANAAAYTGFERGFKDWSVTCDNGKHCETIGAEDTDPDMTLVVRLARDAGPDGRATLSIAAAHPVALNQLRVDGRPLAAAAVQASQWQTRVPAKGDDDNVYPNRLVTADPAAIAGWIAAVRDGQTLSAGDPTRDSTPKVSLAGLSAALLLIDDVQGRVGTVTALLRRGDRPSDKVPAAPMLPPAPVPAHDVPPLSRAEQRTLIDATFRHFKTDVRRSACTDGDDDAASPEPSAAQREESEAYALTSTEALVGLGCMTGSAYNHTALWYRVQRHAPYNGKSYTELTEGFYDTSKAVLTSFEKGRGVGDCGTLTRWIFDGKDFVLSEIRQQGSCFGMSSDEWPLLYRTR